MDIGHLLSVIIVGVIGGVLGSGFVLIPFVWWDNNRYEDRYGLSVLFSALGANTLATVAAFAWAARFQ